MLFLLLACALLAVLMLINRFRPIANPTWRLAWALVLGAGIYAGGPFASEEFNNGYQVVNFDLLPFILFMGFGGATAVVFVWLFFDAIWARLRNGGSGIFFSED